MLVSLGGLNTGSKEKFSIRGLLVASLANSGSKIATKQEQPIEVMVGDLMEDSSNQHQPPTAGLNNDVTATSTGRL